ncbi:MAG: hypothetical protein M3Z09_14115 [Acidobacteriota bacterium]|nr:hypothetical protein [Acidobacteriota bacterium]
MNSTISSLSALLVTAGFLGVGSAQPPPPPPDRTPPAAQSVYSRRGAIKSFNTGPNGETNGVVLRDGTMVTFPPESGARLRSLAKEGSRITVSGTRRSGASGQVGVDAQTITANGQTITVPAAPPPAPAGPGAQAGSGPPSPGPNAPPPPRGRGRGPRRGTPPTPPGAGPLPSPAGGPPPAPANGAPPPPTGV